MNWPTEKISHCRYSQINAPLADKVKQIEGYSPAFLSAVLIQLAFVNQEVEFSNGKAIHISETHQVLLDLNKLDQCIRPCS